MKANDRYLSLTSYNPSRDTTHLTRLYAPILGQDAVSLYHYLLAFPQTEAQPLSQILNHCQISMERLEAALGRLTALDLLVLYQGNQVYYLDLKPCLGPDLFLANPVYRQLLTDQIGTLAVEALTPTKPGKLTNISKPFSEVFAGKGEPGQVKVQTSNYFDLENFEKRMRQDGLVWGQGEQDPSRLHQLAQTYKLTWFDLYQVAKQTAYQGQIFLGRVSTKLGLAKQEAPRGQFSQQEQALIRESKAVSPDQLLAKIKKARRSVVTADETKILAELASRNFLDEVINCMLIYTFSKAKSANLNKTYINKLANDFAFKGIVSSEQAIQELRTIDQKKAQGQETKKTSNVPSWSNPNYKNETSPEEQADLEKFRQELLAKLGKGEK